MESQQILNEDLALRKILEGTASHTGKEFFHALVMNLAEALNTKGAWVAEYIELKQRLRALSFILDDQMIEGYEYDIKDTPCEVAIENKQIVHIPENSIRLFPDDPDFAKYEPMSYLGAPLLDQDGSVLGHLAVLDSRVMPEISRNMAIFSIFAERAASELRRLRVDLQLRNHEEQLSRLFNSAMDAIIEMDPDLIITQVNPAAQQLFENGSHNEMIHSSFQQYLVSESAAKLKNLAHSIINMPVSHRSLWIPGGLKGVNHNGDTFQFEATFSCYIHRKNYYFNLILRNVNARIEAEKRIEILSAETEYLRQELEEIHPTDDIIGKSKVISHLLNEIHQVASTDATVLISGETGTGKELVARAIHNHSSRKDKPLIKVNCASIPENLIESEFFGHTRGAFTGATEQREGRFALADGGTIFLDEIGDLPTPLQSKLLRVLQEGEFEPVGSSHTKKVDCRVIAATNRDLKKMIREGGFRADLYYRLNVFPIFVPSLKERENDVLLLADFFVQRYSQSIGRMIKPLTEADKTHLKSYKWPGNVRELQNVIERAVITSTDGTLNLISLLSGYEHITGNINFTSSFEIEVLTEKELKEIERKNMIQALNFTGWRISGESGAASLIGIPPSTFSSRMKNLGIQRNI
jgi:PAS domain S-box-containing protein